MELMQTIFSDYGFMIGMAAALISYVASITLAVARRNKIKLALVFIIVGALALSAQRWVAKTSEMEKERLEIFRKNLLVTIKNDVTAMRVSVSGISEKLENVSLGSLGHRLVDIEKGVGRRDPLAAFRKGSPAEWQRFSEWLMTDPTTKAAIPCLSLHVNSGHYYRTPLILAYIMTDADTMEHIGPIMQGHWKTFPYVDQFFKKHGHRLTQKVHLGDRRVGFILFFDGPQNLIGYADAMDFARELLVYQTVERESNSPTRTELLFQRTPRNKDPAQEIANAFSSFRKNIIPTSNAKQIVTQLIRNEQTEAIAINGDSMFIIKLETMIKTATAS